MLKCCFTSFGLKVGNVFRQKAKVKGSQQKRSRLNGPAKGKHSTRGWQFGYEVHKNKRMPLSYYHNAYAKCDFKENQSKF